jgi:hypothetical protein
MIDGVQLMGLRPVGCWYSDGSAEIEFVTVGNGVKSPQVTLTVAVASASMITILGTDSMVAFLVGLSWYSLGALLNL